MNECEFAPVNFQQAVGLETLEEIAVEGKEIFLHAGGENFEMIPCLNVHPLWVGALAKWTSEYISGNQEMVLTN